MAEHQRRIYTDPEIYQRYERAFSRDYFKSIAEKTDKVENAVVLPLKKRLDKEGKGFFLGGITDEKGKFFEPSAHIHDFKTETGSLKKGYPFDPNTVFCDPGTVIYGGILFDHFGHFLTESVNRLWFVVKNRNLSYPIVFIKEKNREVSSQIIEFFKLIGVEKERLLFIDVPTKFSKIIVPCQSSVFANYYSELFLVPYQVAAAGIKAKSYERIYLSRRKFRTGITIIGEEKLEKAFKANGFKVIYPERLGLSEQIAYIKGAKEMASVMGTATHLSLFADKGTKNIVLERSENIVDEQILINQAAGLDGYSISVCQNFLPVGHEFSPLLLGITDHLGEFFNDRGFSFNQKDLNRVSDRAVQKFNHAFFARYSSNKYNGALTGIDPVYVRRIKKYCSTAFLTLRQRLFMKRSDGMFRIYTLFGFSFKVRRSPK